jgi:ferredoxin-NADP reductase
MRLRLKKRYAELGEVVSFVFESLDSLTWQAGQYINLTMPDVPPVDADRLFTIASAPYEKDLLITTYIGTSAYKKRMAMLEPGEVIEADQLGGDFVWVDDGRKKLYIAGGIGVTTFRSIILDQIQRKVPNNALLLYAGKNERRPFVAELQNAAKEDPSLEIKDYVEVRLTLNQLLADVPDVFDRTVYLAGSQKFSEDIGEGLIQKGIARNQIKYDYFDGYIDIEY